MTIQLATTVEDQLRELASRQGRAIGALVEEALLEYLVAASITDLSPSEVAETQSALAAELHNIPAWGGGTD